MQLLISQVSLQAGVATNGLSAMCAVLTTAR
jgi:hypothetical protein